MSRQAIFAAIESERAYQDDRWGTTFDDTHTPADWWMFISFYYTRALNAWKINPRDPFAVDYEILRKGLIKVAALVIAQIEAIDRRTV